MTDTVEVVVQETLVVTEDEITIISEGLQGPAGAQGQRGFAGPPGTSLFEMVAGAALSGHRIVYLDTQNTLQYASNDTLAHANRIVGMTLGAVAQGAVAQVKSMGDVEEPGWSWDTNLSVYLGPNGLLTQVAPTGPAAKFSMVVGFPVSSTSLFVNPREPIVLSN